MEQNVSLLRERFDRNIDIESHAKKEGDISVPNERSFRRRGAHILIRQRLQRVALLVIPAYVLLKVIGSSLVDSNLVSLPALPATPKRASATLHTDSNTCYDMALYVMLKSWEASKSAYPMLVLHSVPLPPRVAALASKEDNNIQAIAVPEFRSYVVGNKRWRKCATKFSVWDQTDFDQLAYYDSDHVFVENGDDVFDELAGDGGDGYLYANADVKYPWQFNAGTILIRPSAAIYSKLHELYNRRFFIMNTIEMVWSGDQRFLNAVFAGKWQSFTRSSRIKVPHTKVWKAATQRKHLYAQYKDIAERWISELGLEKEVEECLALDIAF